MAVVCTTFFNRSSNSQPHSPTTYSCWFLEKKAYTVVILNKHASVKEHGSVAIFLVQQQIDNTHKIYIETLELIHKV